MDTLQDLTLAADTRSVHSFVAGYLRARGQASMAQAVATPWGITVRYGPGMDREVEHFVFERQADLDGLAPSDGDWLTVFGGELPAPIGFVLRPCASEFFMASDIKALCRQLDDAPGHSIAAPFADFPTPDSAVFRHEASGRTVSSLRCALGFDGDAVLDRVATEPACRGRGMARSLMRWAAAWALTQGRQRLLLIASPDGHRLYRRLGFKTISPVRVSTLERTAHAH